MRMGEAPTTPQETPPQTVHALKNTRPPFIFLLLLVALIALFAFGLRWIFSLGAQDVGSAPFLLFDYAVGLTMIFLPCTLPLAFVIVPLAMGKSYQKGIGMTLAFGIGVTFTLSIYGALIGLFGQALGVHQVETAKNILYALAGLFALLFALGELQLIPLHMPSYGGPVPQFINTQRDILKAGLLGVFLGNVGVGCPNPLFNAIIVPQIFLTGSPFQGWLIMFVQALGRITPLFILAFLAILGINATKFLVTHKDTVSKITAWATVFVGGFLLTLGLFGHDWWVISGTHTLVEFVTQENFITNFLGGKIGELGHTHEIPLTQGLFGIPLAWGTAFLLIVWILPMVWYYLYRKEAISTLPLEQQPQERRYVCLLGNLFAILSLLLIVVFGYLIPHMFAAHWSQQTTHSNDTHTHEKGMENMPHAHETDTPTDHNHVNQAVSKLPLFSPSTSREQLPFTIQNGVKEFRLEAREFRWEYAPKQWVHVWGYNNQIPGPEIRVEEGDKVRVIVTNNLPDATTVHWHGVDVPWNADGIPHVTQDPIPPGGEFVYEFTATPPGTHFYHTHGKSHETAAQQLDMGLSGPLIIEPSSPAYTYDQEYTLVLDEWDIQRGGTNGALSHIHGTMPGMSVTPEFNTFTINGRVHPATSPLMVKRGEKVLIRLINAGSATFHPMHLHGHNFDVVALDGNPLPSRQRRNTFTLHPGETADILFTADNPGIWVFHCHHVHHAAAGMVTVVQYENFNITPKTLPSRNLPTKE